LHPWRRAFIGIATAGLVYAGAALALLRSDRLQQAVRALSARTSGSSLEDPVADETFLEQVFDALQSCSAMAAWLAFGAALFHPGLEVAVLTLVTGGVLVAGGARVAGSGVAGGGVFLLVHALAYQSPVFGGWPGPALAALGLAVVALSPSLARWRDVAEQRLRGHAHRAALLYTLAAGVYAFAAGGDPSMSGALPSFLEWGLRHLAGGNWMQHPAVPVTTALAAATLLLGATQRRGKPEALGHWGGAMLAGAAAVSGLAVALMARKVGAYRFLILSHGAALALCAAAAAAILHAVHRKVRLTRPYEGWGLRMSRDCWLLATGGLLALVAAFTHEPQQKVLLLAAAAVGLAVAVSLHCEWRERTRLHLYLVQGVLVVLYALVRALYGPGLRPEQEALVLLTLGLALVSTRVLARRAGWV
jgi:hypothetical protein